jgi:hypothetical protein
MSAGRGAYRQAGRQEYGEACWQADKRIVRQAGKNMVGEQARIWSSMLAGRQSYRQAGRQAGKNIEQRVSR